MTAIGFALQVEPTDAASWVDRARRAEAAGFEAISVADHPGSTASPFVALAALATVTSTIGLGTSVLNIGTWEPLALASEVATLALVSGGGGRVVLGVGAGHTPAEWTATGRAHPSAAARVERLTEVVDATLALLRGETVTTRSEHVHLHEAGLRWAEPVTVPLLVGGNGTGVLRYGARVADVVELTGLGRTLPDGHLHVPAWAPAEVDRRVALIDAAAGGRAVRLGALVQQVTVTDARDDALDRFRARLAGLMGEDLAPTLADLAATPYLLVGTEDELVAQLRANRERWGMTRYTVRADALDAVAPIIDRLAL